MNWIQIIEPQIIMEITENGAITTMALCPQFWKFKEVNRLNGISKFKVK